MIGSDIKGTGRRRWLGDTTRSGKNPLGSLIDFADQLVRSDLVALNEGISELGGGDLSARVSLVSQPLRREDYPGYERLADVLNQMQAGMRKCAADLNAATEPPCHRLCYVGADSFLEGYLCGQAMGRALNGTGSVAVLYRPGMVSHQLRRKGFCQALAREYPGVRHYSEVAEGMTVEDARVAAARVIDERREVDGIYSTHGGVPAGIALAVQQAGIIGRVKIVAHDFGDDTMRFVRDGVITAVLGQDPYAQGHEPVIHLFNHLVDGWQPTTPRLLTELELATRENYQRYWQEGRGTARPEGSENRYSMPVKKAANKHLRIGVLGRAPNSFWDFVRQGVEDANDEIRPYNATAEWIVPEGNRLEGKVSAEVYAPVLDSLVQQGYDAIVVGVFDVAMVPHINQASGRGIPIITYNAEPSGLSSMVLLSLQQAEKLMKVSQSLALSIDQITVATEQVKISIDQVSRATVSQNDQVNQANESLDALVTRIDGVSNEASHGSKVAADASAASQFGTESVGRTLNSMQSIRGSVAQTATTVERLATSSERIDTIVKTIGTIAYQIRLLGINAAIEAAHAGDYGAGFSVVASEIRSLGDRSGSATREITQIVETVQQEIHEALDLMSSELQQVQAGADLAERAGQLLTGIRDSVEINKDRLQSIAGSVSQMQAFSRKVGGIMQALTAITEENSAAAEEVGAAAKEMLAELNRINNLAHSLAQMARATEQLLAKFTLADTRR